MADQFNIDATLDRMMHRESGGLTNARGKAGEIGLLQIKPDIAQQYGIDPRFLTNPIVNRYVAKRYLTDLLSQFQNDPVKAVAAYNAGPGNVRNGRIPLSTRAYVRDVLGPTATIGGGTPSRELLRRGSLPVTRSQIVPEEAAKRLSSSMAPPFGGGVSTLELPSSRGHELDPSTLEVPSRYSGGYNGVPIEHSQWSPSEPQYPRPAGEIRNIPNPWERRAIELSGAANELGKKIGSPSFGQGLGDFAYNEMPRSNLGAAVEAASLAMPMARGLVAKLGRGELSPMERQALVRILRAMKGVPTNWKGKASEDLSHAMQGLGFAARKIWGSMSGNEGAQAEDVPPASMIPEGKYRDFTNGKTYTNQGGKVFEVPKSSKLAPQLPWPVRAADYAPMVGQIGGELVGATGAAEGGPPAMAAAAGLGGAGGDMAGEGIRNLIRRHYGLPTRSAREVTNSGLWSGVGSLFGQPISGGVSKIAPGTLKSARRAKEAYEAAETAVGDITSQIEKTLGVDRNTAQALAKDPAMRRSAREAYFNARRGGFERFSAAYDSILRRHVGEITPNSTAGALSYAKSRSSDPKIFESLEQELASHPASVRAIHNFRSLVRQEIRSLNPQEDRRLISELKNVEQAATKDIESRLSPREVAQMKAVDSRYADYVAQFPAHTVRAISRAPNSPEVMKQILEGDSSQIETLIGEIRRMPQAERRKSFQALRESFASYVHDQSTQAPNQLKGLADTARRLDKMPDALFTALYGAGSKPRILNLVRKTMEFHARMLKQPGLAEAVIHEMRATKTPWMIRHAEWIASVPLFHAILEGNMKEAAVTLTVTAGVLGLHNVLNNPAMQRLYLNMVTSETASQIAAAVKALIIASATAGGTEVAKQNFGAEQTGRDAQ